MSRLKQDILSSSTSLLQSWSYSSVLLIKTLRKYGYLLCIWDVHVRPVFSPSQIQDMIGGCGMGGACGHFKAFGLS